MFRRLDNPFTGFALVALLFAGAAMTDTAVGEMIRLLAAMAF